MRKTALAASVSIFAVMPTLGVVDDSKDPDLSVKVLFEVCKGSSDTFATEGRALCLGYISGVVDMMSVTAHHAPAGAFRQQFGVCPEGSAKHRAAVQAFQNWAEKHPEAGAKPNWYGVTQALSKLWPCPASSDKDTKKGATPPAP
jgi:hypothetical protein